MISIKNISTVARYERKILFRSWFFRIFALITLLTLFGMNMGVFVEDGTHWINRAIPANLPLINILYINVAQAIIAIFLASEFLKQDKKLDTTEVIYARPISNGEYVAGKVLGILVLFVGLVILVLLLALVVNLILKDVPIVWEAYILYPVLVTVPTLTYILGLSFFLMILFKSQAVTFIVLLGYIGMTLFYFEDKLYGTLDYMAFNLPMVYSDIIHFTDLKMILLQRGSYFLLGLAFLFATIRFLGRLPQVGKLNFVNTGGAVLFLLGGLFLSYTYFNIHHEEYLDRDRFLELNDTFAAIPAADVQSTNIHLEHKGEEITAAVNVRIRNDHTAALDTLVFSLNPGFEIDSITGFSGPVRFDRDRQIVLILPEQALPPYRRSAYTFYYHGRAIDHIAYLDIPKREQEALRKIQFATIDKDAVICKEDYLLFTPEIQWYPSAGVGFNRENYLPRQIDFSRFELDVVAAEGMLPVSSGEVIKTDSSTSFKNSNDLDGISLTIGKFEKRSLQVDDLEYNLYLLPGHDYFSEYFDKIKDTIPDILKEEKENYEFDDLDLYYSFDRINLVETPVQFHAYDRPYTTSTEFIQPEMILLPERGCGLASLGLNRRLNAIKSQDRRSENKRSDEEIQVELLRRLLRSTFFQAEPNIYSMRSSRGGNNGESLIEYRTKFKYDKNPYCVFPLYYDRIAGISSTDYPIFNAMIQLYLRDGFEVSFRESFRGGTSDKERANLALKDKELKEVFRRRGNDLIASVISQSSGFVIQAIRNKVGIEEFDTFLYYYIEDHAFAEITFEDFSNDFMEEFEVDIRPYLDFINSKNSLATFLLSTPEYIQSRDEFGEVYVVRMKISNIGESLGMINISFRMPGQGGGGPGGGDSEERIFEIPGKTTKEIQMVFYDQPRMMTVNTLISGNIPSNFSVFLRSAINSRIVSFEEYETVVPEMVNLDDENEIIVDNEDPGFSYVSVSNESKIKQYIDSQKESDNDLAYRAISPYWTPPVWTPVAHSAFYGHSIRSAMVARQGDGNNTAKWTCVIPEPGFYEVYAYIPVTAMYRRPSNRGRGEGRQGGRGGGGRGSGPEFADRGTEYTYTISSNEGNEQSFLTLNMYTEGWNKIGTFHFPADTASVELSNACQHGFRVVADAIKWVKTE